MIQHIDPSECNCDYRPPIIMPKTPCPVHGNQSDYTRQIQRRIEQMNYPFNTPDSRIADLERRVRQLEAIKGVSVMSSKSGATATESTVDPEIAEMQKKLVKIEMAIKIARMEAELANMKAEQ